MPPAPMGARISCGPKRIPMARDIGASIHAQGEGRAMDSPLAKGCRPVKNRRNGSLVLIGVRMSRCPETITFNFLQLVRDSSGLLLRPIPLYSNVIQELGRGYLDWNNM